jgi:trans-2,3-dihydro-3-hydroxyanthranilate isomerase
VVTGYPYLIVDVFTSEALTGNQLAVFTEGQTIPRERLQPLALEMGFSETVFVFPPVGHETARVRIFTPTSEVPFAGHPVLGTAVALAIAGGLDRVDLVTPQGNVPLEIADRTVSGAFGRMQQPIPTVAPLPDPRALFAALRVTGSELPVEIYDNGLPHVYVALPDEAAVAAVAPDYGALADLARARDMPIVGINCFAGAGRRWKTRMFAPADGVAEDAATGSAAGPLACHLARHGRIAFGDEIVISQGAEIGRPSTLYATAHGSHDAITRVEVAGTAVVVASGAFHLP